MGAAPDAGVAPGAGRGEEEPGAGRLQRVPALPRGGAGLRCRQATRFTIGGYRHTVAANAVRAGATSEAVAHFLGHKGSYMVKAIYAKVAVPKKGPDAGVSRHIIVQCRTLTHCASVPQPGAA